MRILAAVCIGALIIGLPRASSGARLRSVLAVRVPRRRVHTSPTLLRFAAVGLLAASISLVIGGMLGLALGAVTLVAAPAFIRRLSTAAETRAHARRVKDAPHVATLLAACLASGATPEHAVRAVADGFEGPTADGLREVDRALALGEPVDRAFARLWPPALGTAIARSAETGAPLVDVLPGVAADLRRDARTTAEVAARSAGVRAVGPLAACFLPAFLLVGVVPVVVGLARSVLG
jgi:Flp pilus assembly protein TadB